MKESLILIGIVVFLSCLLWLLWVQVLAPTNVWYDECRELEKEIREEDNQEKQLKELYRLNKFSWHRTTSVRMRELGLMMEMKYNLKILKRNIV